MNTCENIVLLNLWAHNQDLKRQNFPVSINKEFQDAFELNNFVRLILKSAEADLHKHSPPLISKHKAPGAF